MATHTSNSPLSNARLSVFRSGACTTGTTSLKRKTGRWDWSLIMTIFRAKVIEKVIKGEIDCETVNLFCGRMGANGVDRNTEASLALNLWASLSDSCALVGEELQHLICVLVWFMNKNKLVNPPQNTFLLGCCALFKSFTSLQLRTSLTNNRFNFGQHAAL